MRVRHRLRSEEITFSVKVEKSIQGSYGQFGALGIKNTRVFSTAFQCLTSEVPLHARFLDPPAPPAPPPPPPPP
jgi:hypothetical protein